jgi:hypothetical protein
MNESIFEDEAFNMKVHAMIEGTVELLNPEANCTWRETWNSIKTQLRSMGIAESMRRRKKDTEHIKSLKRTRDGLKGEIDAGLATQPKVSRYIELESETNVATKQNTPKIKVNPLSSVHSVIPCTTCGRWHVVQLSVMWCDLWRRAKASLGHSLWMWAKQIVTRKAMTECTWAGCVLCTHQKNKSHAHLLHT